jgi:hypothetical protein
MRGWVLLFGLAGAVACSSSSSGGGPDSGNEAILSGTNCPSANIGSTSCVSCIQTSCATSVSSLSLDCTSIEVNCFCQSGGNAACCALSQGCATANHAWTSCVQSNCSKPCEG